MNLNAIHLFGHLIVLNMCFTVYTSYGTAWTTPYAAKAVCNYCLFYLLNHIKVLRKVLLHCCIERMIPKHINADGSHRRHQLTAIRVVRGILCLAVLLTTACMTLIYCAPLFTLLLRLFSIHYSRKVVALLFGAWLSMWPFLFEKINNTKVVFSGDSVPSKERVLLFANHRTEVDWMYLWDLALRKGCLGSIKYVLKSSLMKLPVFGWGFQVLEFISVERKWEIDESMMRRKLSTFKDTRDSLWLAVFPEGTDYT